MVIFPDISGSVYLKIPNNLQKPGFPYLTLKNTETKNVWTVMVADHSNSKLYYLLYFVGDTFRQRCPYGEYEYDLSGNIGILRVVKDDDTKEYNDTVEFKSYEDN